MTSPGPTIPPKRGTNLDLRVPTELAAQVKEIDVQMVLRSALVCTLALSSAAASAQGLVMEPEDPLVIEEPAVVGVPAVVYGELTEQDAVAIAMMHGIVRVEDVDTRMWDGNFEVDGEDASGDDLEIRIDSKTGEVLEIDD
jgi:hypothetical protein